MPEHTLATHVDIVELYTQQAQQWQGQQVGHQGVLPVTEKTLAILPTLRSSPIECPWYASHTNSDSGFQVLLWIDPTLVFFRGHFTGAPILPGVTQVHWATDAATRLFNFSGTFSGLSKLKFKAPTHPKTWLQMELQKSQNHIDFAFRDHQQVRTQGRILFHG